MSGDWLEKLQSHVEQRPIVILRFRDEEWDQLTDSRRGPTAFTIAVPHRLVGDIRCPAPCLILGKSDSVERLYLGLLVSKGAATTLQSRVRISRAVRIQTSSAGELAALVTQRRHAANLADRLRSGEQLSLLPPKLSSHLVERLASIKGNRAGMRMVADGLAPPKQFDGNASFQVSAIQTALAAFGLSASDQATDLELVEGKSSALGSVAILEDSVVEHDARSVPGLRLVKSDVTGRAVFRNRDEELEVITANRRELEHCLGVDLIYVNLTRQNVVMLQYKMLEPSESESDDEDWIYRPDAQLRKEIKRMDAFAARCPIRSDQYRLNPTVFYLKFVKRDARLASGGIITPLDHFKQILSDPMHRGPRNGLRIGFKALNGRYMRHVAFIDLLRSGYIGADASTTTHIRTLIDAVLDANTAVVAAIQYRPMEQ